MIVDIVFMGVVLMVIWCFLGYSGKVVLGFFVSRVGMGVVLMGYLLLRGFIILVV